MVKLLKCVRVQGTVTSCEAELSCVGLMHWACWWSTSIECVMQDLVSQLRMRVYTWVVHIDLRLKLIWLCNASWTRAFCSFLRIVRVVILLQSTLASMWWSTKALTYSRSMRTDKLDQVHHVAYTRAVHAQMRLFNDRSLISLSQEFYALRLVHYPVQCQWFTCTSADFAVSQVLPTVWKLILMCDCISATVIGSCAFANHTQHLLASWGKPMHN